MWIIYENLKVFKGRIIFFLFCSALSDLICCHSPSYTFNSLASFLGFGSVVETLRGERHGKQLAIRPSTEFLEAWGGGSPNCFPITQYPAKLERRKPNQFHSPFPLAGHYANWECHAVQEHVAGGMKDANWSIGSAHC